MRVTVSEVADQKKALEALADVVEKSTVDPLVRNAALAITADCDARDDMCEITAVFNAVKTGTSAVMGLENGLKYVSDPRYADFFTTPPRLLRQLALGINGEDCDGHTALICALLGSLGFVTGLRAWGKTGDEYTHVYAVVGYPKLGYKELLGLDTTVEDSEVGWEPPGGKVLTALLDGT